MNAFAQLGLNDDIVQAIQKLGFENPTPIQEKSIPHLLTSTQDLVAFAQTGTGKTGAFGLPAVHLSKPEDKRTQTLILCPTRELCIQISKDLNNFAKNIKGIGVVPVYGGAPIDTQLKALRKAAQIVVATPGRAKDLIKRKRLLLGNVERVVLDEADEMLNMGFKEDLDAILAETSATKQTLLFSATMSREVQRMTKTYMDNPIEIAATKMNTGAVNVKHIYYMVQAKNRYEVLKRIADSNPNIYGLVFCRTRQETKDTAHKFMHDGYNADALHGELSQAQRDEVMKRFRSKKIQILVATDVAARGLDINDLTHVVNYNLPDDSEVYIHRSGRTGRAGKSGISIAIIHTREYGKIRAIENKFKLKFTKELVPTGKDICSKQLYSLIDKIEKVDVDEKQIGPFMPAIYEKLEWLSREELIKHFVSAEFNRFLTYYKHATDINVSADAKPQRGERPGRRDRNKRGDRVDSQREQGPHHKTFTRLFINLGMKNDLTPTRLIGLINKTLNSNEADVGAIEIMKKFAFFDIEQGVVNTLVDKLHGQEHEGVKVQLEVSTEKPTPLPTKKKKFSKQKEYGMSKSGRRGSRSKKSGISPRRSRKK
ncbi:MAG: DEAD/DEAH box helicase [Candidatus Marinimicrobia bacterium]|jgi:ATP-dependent RNA helicase DeaD|nr:DEAD/DEAH box helicase [Candidatus Neomarinimicrobiota bacterium]MBT4361794.1 DEAD/DEAH box helicase [Candidatus Neomarinimicrobiota bacterium]MBT4714450.1 DEAD/DEAH box helicase [Candidatus Neomarinimicrobiota bacterium]MBT4946151.1 DEAD/DEAH box helicase [Candidatus Neomarinimicrobiota bacterium]MBT5268950.1 DEAD/DEAH box helicase [Candidatus Neomarinimicrobiota bacterium]